MRIVIAGGTGFIGEPLVRRLVARGDELAVLSRNPTKVHVGRGIEWDGRTQGEWSAEVANADAIINLAGENVGEDAGLTSGGETRPPCGGLVQRVRMDAYEQP